MFLEPGREILVASSGAEVAELLGGLNLADRQRIAEAGRTRVLAEHTYAQRARQVTELLQNGIRVREAAA
jgi:spore maturation protein CgeB